LQYLLKRDKKTVQKLNLDYVLRDINPDLIHLQWVSNISTFESYLKDKSYRFVFSLRGYHINVRPFVNNTNANYLREFIPLFKGLHGVSNSMFNQLRKLKIDLDSITCRTIYSGHVSSKITKQDFYRKSCLNIILVGRNHWKKNYSNSLIALRNLLDEEYMISFTFIGLNKSDSEELLFLANELKLNSYIFFKGNLSKKELDHYYLNSDALLLPSYEEGVANVCIEAMHFGLPVISSRAGGMTELIDKNSGILLDNQNPEGIEKGIKRFLSMNQESINEISENALKTVRSRFAKSKMIEDFNKFYNDLV
jgi:colanic acid/amylovoran biosynthesis glycosyltransferase